MKDVEATITLKSRRSIQTPEITFYQAVERKHLVELKQSTGESSMIINVDYVGTQIKDYVKAHYDTTKYPYLVVCIGDGPEVFIVLH